MPKYCGFFLVGRFRDVVAQRICCFNRYHGRGEALVLSPALGLALILVGCYMVLAGSTKCNLPRRPSSWLVSCTLSPLLQPVQSGRHIPKDVFSHPMWRISTILSTCHDEIDGGLPCDMRTALAYSVCMPTVYHTQEHGAHLFCFSFLLRRCYQQPHTSRLISKPSTLFTPLCPDNLWRHSLTRTLHRKG